MIIDPFDTMTAGPTRLEIDLAAIVANWRRVAAETPHGRAAAVVKADGYGCGAAPVGKALYRAGARLFFTAHLSEALALRQALPQPDVEIGVFNGLLPGEAESYRADRILPVLNDLGQIETWADFCRRHGTTLPACIQIDTGMRRLGLPPYEVETLRDKTSRLAGIEFRYLLSHMAAGDDPAHGLNAVQRDAFAAACTALPKPSGGAMLAASSGAFLGADYAFDWVRPGYALYGGNPVPGRPNPMTPVIRLTARILQTRRIAKGDTVGYGATWMAEKPSHIATIALGYADGYLRSLSSRGVVHLDGTPIPVVGRVSMDLVTLDISAIPGTNPGMEVEVIGPHQGVDAAAEKAGTIGYEILTGLGARYARIYSGE